MYIYIYTYIHIYLFIYGIKKLCCAHVLLETIGNIVGELQILACRGFRHLQLKSFHLVSTVDGEIWG